MGFTNEEISSGKISVFDHLADPANRLTVISCMRLLQYLPMLEQSVYDRLVEQLEEQNKFRQIIKYKLKSAGKLIDDAVSQVYKEMGLKNDEVPHDMFFGIDMADNLINSFIDYISMIEILTNVDEVETEESRTDKIFNKAKMLCQLKKGDRFIFIDQLNAVEYTFSHYTIGEHQNRETDITVYYNKVSSDVTFTERDIFRPVVISNPLNQNIIDEVKKLISKIKEETK